jgi:hypothetical protein
VRRCIRWWSHEAQRDAGAAGADDELSDFKKRTLAKGE